MTFTQETEIYLQKQIGHAPQAFVYASFGSHFSFVLNLLMGPMGGVMMAKKSGFLILDKDKIHYLNAITGDFKKETFSTEKAFTLDLTQIEKAKNLKIGVVDYLTLTKKDGEKISIQINRFMKLWNKDQAAHADKIKAAVGA